MIHVPMSLPMNTHPSFSKAREEFNEACNNADSTLVETDPVDVNALLQMYYSASEPVRLTRTMLWDAEAKKAWDPMTYIPGVVREGSSWGRKPLGNGEEYFLRESQQFAWRTDIYGQVLEEVYLSPQEQSILFLGRAELLRDDGSPIQAGNHQPLFHVEHAVDGTNSRPENLWRIVHLTSKRDDILLKEHVAQTGAPEWLQKFVAIYVERDLGISLMRH